ncbi:DUF350 domain-containing protein [Arenicella sp. 4NH20-0111]|uniref:DUF350 domain-containing protein n=1 Tax=Arenicella sp. 4NH20-0111 TaxID=3127648 RepID=UPI00310A3B1B
MNIDQIITLLINIVVCLLFVVPVRFALAKHLGVDAKHELDSKDNFAFGVSIAGGVLGLIFMLTGVQSGDPLPSHVTEIISLLMYGLLGSLLLIAGVLIQDKLVIRDVELATEIKNGNMSAAIIVAANMAVVGLVAKKTLSWVDSEQLDGLIPVIAVFVISQVVLAAVAGLRMGVYRSRNRRNSTNGIDAADTWQGAIKAGNVAIALRYAGQLIATGIAITITSALVDSESMGLYESVGYWAFYAFGLAGVIWGAYRLFLPLVLYKVNVVEEVDHQANVGVAAVEAALMISLAFMVLAYLV